MNNGGISRNLSLDVFRGLIIALMIIVNTQGAGAKPYALLGHAEWFGFTFADFVFPSFLFIMGCSLAFSSASKLGWDEYFVKITKRTIILFALGLFLNWFPFFLFNAKGQFEWRYFENLRFMGVLQRLALCYFLAALLVKAFPKHIIIIASFMLLFYWGMMVFGAPNGMAFDKLQNIGTRIDNFVIPKSHIFRRDGGFEPEGLLGTIPAAVNMLAGFVAAKYMQNNSNIVQKFIVVGFSLTLFGCLWGMVFPISKKLWTSSYVVLNIGLDLILLAIFVFIYDYKKYKFGIGFFEVFGKNPLGLYMFSLILLKIFIAIKLNTNQGLKNLHVFLGEDVFQKIASGAMGSFLYSIAFMFICYGFGYILHSKNLILKV